MPSTLLYEEALTESAIGAFYEVYNRLGFGFLEHVYVNALSYELGLLGHRVARELSVCVMYKGIEIARQRLDLVVDDNLVIEAKSSYTLPAAASRQLHNYLRATTLEVGLLFHFGPKPRFERLICTNKGSRPGRAKNSHTEVEQARATAPE
jgi:GxxExxY protein